MPARLLLVGTWHLAGQRLVSCDAAGRCWSDQQVSNGLAGLVHPGLRQAATVQVGGFAHFARFASEHWEILEILETHCKNGKIDGKNSSCGKTMLNT